MTPHVRIAIGDASQVGEARRTAVRVAADHGFDEVATGRVALVVTELGTNLARHAERGSVLIGRGEFGGRRYVDVIAVDHGPGMADVNACLRDGFSSAGTAGNGLGAVKRLADQFSVFSRVGEGTVIATRVQAPLAPGDTPAVSAFELSGVCLSAPGEVVSGDGWAFSSRDGCGQLMVVDGLGHGPGAAEAAAAALECFRAGVSEEPAEAVNAVHDALRGTRGAAVAIATLDTAAGTVNFSGAGNVVGRIISGVDDRGLLTQHGTAGVQIHRSQNMRYAWPEHAILILHSDGLKSRWNFADVGGLLQCDPAVIAGRLLRDETRGRDDVTVAAVRRRYA